MKKKLSDDEVLLLGLFAPLIALVLVIAVLSFCNVL